MKEQHVETRPDTAEYPFPDGVYVYTQEAPAEHPDQAPPIIATDLAQTIYEYLSAAAKSGRWALYLNLRGVKYMSSRYAKWLVRKILKDASNDEECQHVRIILAGASEVVLEQIEESLAIAKYVTFVVERTSDEPRILGELDEVFRASFEAIRKNGPMNALELSQILRIKRPTAANYLEKLCNLGLISKMKYRGRKGTAYRYHFKSPAAAE